MVGVLARSVFPLHGYGGLERHVHDLVRHLCLSGVEVTLITRPALPGAPRDIAEAFFEGRTPDTPLRLVENAAA